MIGSDIDCMRVVGDVLQKAINIKESKIELWGKPSMTADLLTQEALMLASMTDSGTYIYVWDASYGSLAEEKQDLPSLREEVLNHLELAYHLLHRS